MAMLFAATHPDRVTHLALYGTFAVGADTLRDEGDPVGLAWSAEIRPQFADAIENWGEGRTIDFYAAKVAHRPLERRIWASWERSGASPGVIRHLFESNMRMDVRSALPSISAPTVVVHFRDKTGPCPSRWRSRWRRSSLAPASPPCPGATTCRSTSATWTWRPTRSGPSSPAPARPRRRGSW